MDSEDDLENYWDDLKPQKLVQVVSTRGSDLEGMLALAAEQTSFDLANMVKKKYVGLEMSPALLADIVSSGVQLFMRKWREALTHQNLTGLIEIVLEGQNLSVDEIRGFVQALPVSILQRIAQSAADSASGTHGLMSLEYLRRTAGVTYILGTQGARIWAEFSHPRTKETVRFFLDEAFSLPND